MQRSPNPVVAAGVESGGGIEAVCPPCAHAKPNKGQRGCGADGVLDALRLVPWGSLRGEGKKEETISSMGSSEEGKKQDVVVLVFEIWV